eukprot:6181282-Pleurochrysis_carterae.AAC.2
MRHSHELHMLSAWRQPVRIVLVFGAHKKNKFNVFCRGTHFCASSASVSIRATLRGHATCQWCRTELLALTMIKLYSHRKRRGRFSRPPASHHCVRQQSPKSEGKDQRAK